MVKSTIYTLSTFEVRLFWSISIYAQPFYRYKARYKAVDNRLFTERRQSDLEHLNEKNTQCTLSTYSQCPFAIHVAVFEIQDLLKNGKNYKCTKKPQADFKHLNVKLPCIS